MHCRLAEVEAVGLQEEVQRGEEERIRSCRHIAAELGEAPFVVVGRRFASWHVPGERQARGRR